MRPFKNLSKIGAPALGKYLRSEKMSFSILIRLGVLSKTKRCPLCEKEMKIFGEENGYFYCTRPCNTKISRRNGSILENMKIKYTQFIIFVHYYYHKTIITKNIMRDVNISRGMIMKLKYLIENKIKMYNRNSLLKMGGIGKIVEVDESLIASSKYGKGRFPEQTWVFGIVERETGKCFIKVIEDRKRATLEKIITSIVRESTIICTDQAKMYNSLNEIGYIHFNVCHKTNFVDPDTGAHTQTIESLWNHFKKKKHCDYGISKTRLVDYCEVFNFFRNFKNMEFDDFLKILK
ncbi:hypothetical protein DMUE_5965 [Dictyocoela muelleri]|nr:hypothetical protein DMUE_5965 [Dictyocoela muelleri]